MRRLFYRLIFSSAVLAFVLIPQVTRAQPAIGDITAGPGAMIDLEGLLPQDCRIASQMPTDTTQARAQLPCRKVKVVQDALNLLIDPRHVRVANEKLSALPFVYPGEDLTSIVTTHATVLACLTDGMLLGESIEDFCDGILGYQPEIDDIRRQLFFGQHWDGDVSGIPGDCKENPFNTFEGDLKAAFPKMAALLIAASMPTDRVDAEIFDEAWMWELPNAYARIPDLNERAEMMIEDVNGWIADAGISVFADAGTTEAIDEGCVPGDFDFILEHVVNFLHIFQDRPDLLSTKSVERLIFKDAFGTGPLIGLPTATWAGSAVPFSGQGYERELWYGQNIPLEVPGPLPLGTHIDFALAETENHVLMVLAHYYLINQWLSTGKRGAPEDLADVAPPGVDPDKWFATEGSPLQEKLRDVLARVPHNGFFETNARPYHGHTASALIALAGYAEDDLIRTEAQNALHFAATKFAFQSYEGRRFTPQRRNCEYVDELNLYNRDSLGRALGWLSGAYKWNDSPYGFRTARQDPPSCFSEDGPLGPGLNPDCPWRFYTWKRDAGIEGIAGSDDPAIVDNVPVNPEMVDTFAEKIPATVEEMADDMPGPVFSNNLYLLFSGYELPRAIHDFMLDKQDGYYARMTSQYEADHYPIRPLGGIVTPGYFTFDQPFQSSGNNERVPEFYFAGPGFMNIAGGIYNPLYDRFFQDYFSGGEDSPYGIPSNPFPPGISTCNGGNKAVEQYDFLSKPYSVLTSVPSRPDALDHDEDGIEDEPLFYAPFGTWEQTDPGYNLTATQENMPMMRGDIRRFYKSANIATYKNFSYGYAVRRQDNVADDLEWFDLKKGVFDQILNLAPSILKLLDTYLAPYSKKDLDFPHYIPPSWEAENVPRADFSIQAASFRVYDLRDLMEDNGQAPLYMITARVRKKSAGLWSKKVSRGFWEVVPGDAFPSLEALVQRVKDFNPKGNFRFGYTDTIFGNNKHYKYRLAVSGERIRLSQYYGAIFENLRHRNEGTVQGIISIADNEGDEISRAEVHLHYMNSAFMNRLPLIDVKAVEPDFGFARLEPDANDEGADPRGPYLFYACAQNGWFFVNRPPDPMVPGDQGRWFFADSRRNQIGAPYFQGGTFTDDEVWRTGCGAGTGGGWVPQPPENGEPDECSNPDDCPRPNPDGGPDNNDGPQCTSVNRTCETVSQCQRGEICADLDGDGRSQCMCDPALLPDLVPLPGHSTNVVGLPGNGYCAPRDTPGASQEITVRVRNFGGVSAAASQIMVDFEGVTAAPVDVAQLDAGDQATRTIPIPSGCYANGTSCGFDIIVDGANSVVETFESNNEASAFCHSAPG